MGNVRIKNISIAYKNDNRFNIYINTVDGYGFLKPSINIFQNQSSVSVIDSNTIRLTGQIINPTGIQPAIFYRTGILNGFATNTTLGGFTWNNVFITGQGKPNEVYLNYSTGQIQARNNIIFNQNLLTTGDILNINNTSFTYNPNKSSQNYLEFDSFSNLINILNSGSTGAFNSAGYSLLQNTVGVTGFINGNTLNLFSFRNSGDDGNSNRVYRDCNNLEAIKINSRYFTGGQYFRPKTDTWFGNFSRTFTRIFAENSGFYSENISETVSSDISGLIWVDNFSGNYYITTGIRDINNLSNFKTGLIPFQNNRYIGSGFIPSGQFSIPTGLSIEISKPNPYNISGNIAKYIFSGDNFIFSGFIEG